MKGKQQRLSAAVLSADPWPGPGVLSFAVHMGGNVTSSGNSEVLFPEGIKDSLGGVLRLLFHHHGLDKRKLGLATP